MGTNFYTTVNGCDACGREDQVHVGKRSGGWSFIFRAYPHDADTTSPFGVPVLSRRDWVQTIAGLAVVNEYGDEVPDPAAWIAGLVVPSPAQIEWENANMGPMWRPDPTQEWRDPEGFRFQAREFS